MEGCENNHLARKYNKNRTERSSFKGDTIIPADQDQEQEITRVMVNSRVLASVLWRYQGESTF